MKTTSKRTPRSAPAIPAITITLDASGDYTADLRRRLQMYGISQGALAREMGIAASQLSRWMNTELQPRIGSVLRIERAIIEIRTSRAREELRVLQSSDEN